MDKLTNALAARFASPTRGTRLTVVLVRWLGLSFTICFLTGLFNHGLQEPPSWMFFLTRPVWIYQLTQGVHVTVDIAASPLLPAKLWSMYPEPARWRGVRIGDLVSGVGAPSSSSLRVTSLEPEGPYRTMLMPSAYVQDEQTLAALELNGQTLDLDHGYPARIIAPGRPGVLQTKWLKRVVVL